MSPVTHVKSFAVLAAAAKVRQIVAQRHTATSRWAAIVVYLILALGIPIPMPAGHRSSEPYPCMDHRCGCPTAEDCWRHCCCMTLEEKLIWARENHVTPPEYVLAEARAQGIQWAMIWPTERRQNSQMCACCAKCSSRDQNKTCCEKEEKSTTPDSSSRASELTGVVLIAALKCHGDSANWIGLAASLAPPEAVRAAGPEQLIGECAVFSERAASICIPPSVPPPRKVACG